MIRSEAPVSIHMIEKALFDIAAGPGNTAEYKRDPAAFLKRYALTDEETALIRDLDVREIIARDANAMLAMRAFSCIEGRDRMPEYMRRLNTPA